MKHLRPTIRLFTFVLFPILLSCASKTETKDEKVSDPNALPALGTQALTDLYVAAEVVDMIFYDMPISLNQDDAKSAKNSVLYISPTVATFNPSCKALGRLSWMTKGAIYKEADIYVDSLCNYFVFMENNQPVAINAMSESGIQFFKTIISQVPSKPQ
ncbi:MAG: hypothetical protein ABIQ11_11210 [Saprospiraceae bacterium]